MKSTLFKLALGAALSIASTLALADRDHDDRDRRDYRDHSRGDYRNGDRDDRRGDYRVEGPRRWGHPHGHYRHFNHRPNWHNHWKHHVHDRWCDHRPPAVRLGPRYLGPRHSGFGGGHHYNDSGITLIIRSDLN